MDSGYLVRNSNPVGHFTFCRYMHNVATAVDFDYSHYLVFVSILYRTDSFQRKLVILNVQVYIGFTVCYQALKCFFT